MHRIADFACTGAQAVYEGPDIPGKHAVLAVIHHLLFYS